MFLTVDTSITIRAAADAAWDYACKPENWTASNPTEHFGLTLPRRPHLSFDSWKDEQRKDPTLAARGVILITDRDLSLGHFSGAEVGQFWRASRGPGRCFGCSCPI